MNKALLQFKHVEAHKWVMAFAVLTALFHFLLVLFIVISRINYRYDLEWMEGASLVQAYRIASGLSLYTQPSLVYIPLIYPPLYFYLAAVMVKILGVSFLPLRIVSFASTVGCLIIIFLIVREKTRSVLTGFIASGAFVAAFRLGGAWFDIARVDMLFVFLCLSGVYSLGKQKTASSIIAGALFSLAILTKQTAISIFAVAAVSTLLLFRKQFLPLVGSFIVLSSIAYFCFNLTTNGWYQYYILTLPGSYQIRWSSFLTTLQTGFVIEGAIVLISLSPLISFRTLIRDKLFVYYYLATGGFVTTSILARMNHGAYDNTLLPAYASLAILFGLGIGWLTGYFDASSFNKNILQSILWLVISIQFIALIYDPIIQIPTQADIAAGDNLVSEIRTAPGDVLIPYHNYLALYAKKKVFFHFVAFNDVRSIRTRIKPELRNILQQFHATPFSLLIMDLPDDLIQNDHCADKQEIAYETAGAFYPVTGYIVRPALRYFDCP